ncbi:hypothetical protein [Thermomonospora amylolytica]|uniref:hypothetical protein n=1 Tax=Thermomonospora amylolytica TaxID=1411117 RepID=UPI0013003B17|nr:hypothetical protein [Thermomonospora amylolytica]
MEEEPDILTEDGWRSVQAVSPGQVVLTLNHETGLAEWQPLLELQALPTGRHKVVRMRGRSHSSLTLLEHRWPVERFYRRTGTTRQKNPDGTWKSAGRASRTLQGRERVWATSETLTYWDRIPIAAPLANAPRTPTWSDALVELVGWFWTEGHIKPQSRSRLPSTGVAIYQSHRKNPEKVTRIRSALHQAFGPPVEAFPRGHRRDGAPRWREAINRQLSEFHLSVDAGRVLIELAPDRVPRMSFLRRLTKDQLDLFIDASLMGDGHGNEACVQLSQKNRAAAEAFQTAAVLAGYAASLRAKQPTRTTSTPMWTVTIRKQAYLCPRPAAQSGRGFIIAQELHEGALWCPRTPNGTWLARKDGHVYFTGAPPAPGG